MAVAMRNMDQRRVEKIEGKIRRREEQYLRKRKRGHLRVYIPISVGIMIAVLELFFYFRVSIPDVEEFIPSENLALMTMIIDQALQDYGVDHGGEFPHRLEELLGKYLPPEKIGASFLVDFTYIRSSPHSYELRCNKMDDNLTPESVFTEKGQLFGH